jgi:hypothetical protein
MMRAVFSIAGAIALAAAFAASLYCITVLMTCL